MAELRYDTWKRSPEEALQRAFDEASQRLPWSNRDNQSAFLWQSLKGKGEDTVYGSFQNIRKDSLVGRKYEIQFWDGQVTIHWLDAVHNARSGNWPNRNEWIDESREGCPPKC